VKVYLITEAQMESLCERLELAEMRKNNVLSQHDTERFKNHELFRAFNFVVRRWITEMGGSS